MSVESVQPPGPHQKPTYRGRRSCLGGDSQDGVGSQGCLNVVDHVLGCGVPVQWCSPSSLALEHISQRGGPGCIVGYKMTVIVSQPQKLFEIFLGGRGLGFAEGPHVVGHSTYLPLSYTKPQILHHSAPQLTFLEISRQPHLSEGL